MNLWLNPSHYFSYNKETISNRSIIFRNLGLVLISMFFVTCILFQLLPDMMEGSLFVTFAFITAISVPFYFIFNFFISLLYLMVLIFFHPALKIGKFYTIILTYHSLLFFINAISVNLILLNESLTAKLVYAGLIILGNLWGTRILFFGLMHFVGYKKKVSLIFCITLITINLLLFIGGFFVNG